MKAKLFGILLFFETAALLLVALVAAHYNVVNGETDAKCFLITAALTFFTGLVLYIIGRSNGDKTLHTKDTYLVVGLSWVLFSVFGMLPFLLYGTMDNVTDAFFETMSGFSTTGATVINNIDEQPHGILFWRSLMQWLGGLGIIVFTLAFIPSVAKGSKKRALFAAEATGVGVEKLSPKMQGTARSLWIIYIVLTLLCTFAYWLGPMNAFDAVCHALSTVATGGFSTHQASIGYFQSSYIEYMCVLFMLLSGINFSLYYFAFTRRFESIRQNEELKWYLRAIVMATVLFFALFHFSGRFEGVTAPQLADMPQSAGDRLRAALFHTVTLLSTTGFQAEHFNYDYWGILFVIPTLVLMIIGGCAGSTSGGFKMIRVVIIWKYMKLAVSEFVHPTGMFSVKLSKQSVDDAAIRHVCAFFSLFILLFMVNAVVLTAAGMNLDDALASFLTCFSSFGPGSGLTGPDGTFAAVPAAAKWILAFDMLVGRLEIFTVLLLFTRSFWKAN